MSNKDYLRLSLGAQWNIDTFAMALASKGFLKSGTDNR